MSVRIGKFFKKNMDDLAPKLETNSHMTSLYINKYINKYMSL